MSNTNETANPIESKQLYIFQGVPEITPSFWWGSYCLFVSFLCCFMCSIVCLFLFFSLLARRCQFISIYECDCPSVIFRPSFKFSNKYHNVALQVRI